ncbi:zinc finger protein 813-like [Mya arenaria]|uniref:zinc finger protein 813-like n=1 Tax=Mya arenaria TaxID=6604 RepID=UPI0022E632C9|nr:zinc finger protein 813-like [Mya arenaria]XP_052818524.1 zinc finger protein 813-like [Mya arenaria]
MDDIDQAANPDTESNSAITDGDQNSSSTVARSRNGYFTEMKNTSQMFDVVIRAQPNTITDVSKASPSDENISPGQVMAVKADGTEYEHQADDKYCQTETEIEDGYPYSPSTEADADFEDDLTDEDMIETYYCDAQNEEREDVQGLPPNKKKKEQATKHENNHQLSGKKGTATGRRKREKCDICNKVFLKSSLSGHKSFAHNVYETPQKCKVCGITKYSITQLKRHERQHFTYSMKCDECEYETRYPSTFKRHQEMHRYQRGEIDKKFECDICGNRFISLQNLKTHSVTHQELKPYLCSLCGEQFAQKNNCKLHCMKHCTVLPGNSDGNSLGDTTTVLTTTSETASGQAEQNTEQKLDKAKKRFSCEDCQKTFSFKHDLKRHMKNVHQGLKQFSCSDCKKNFADISALKLHLASFHSRLRNFPCTKCPKRYNNKYRLQRHLSGVHGEQVGLDELEKMYGGKSSLNKTLLKSYTMYPMPSQYKMVLVKAQTSE